MYSTLDQRTERINNTYPPSGNLGSCTSDAIENKHSPDTCTISLTFCYKYQWTVVFQEQDSALGSGKTENSSIV